MYVFMYNPPKFYFTRGNSHLSNNFFVFRRGGRGQGTEAALFRPVYGKECGADASFGIAEPPSRSGQRQHFHIKVNRF
jgi:hypothetical protein